MTTKSTNYFSTAESCSVHIWSLFAFSMFIVHPGFSHKAACFPHFEVRDVTSYRRLDPSTVSTNLIEAHSFEVGYSTW